jgi:hypothetical protein
MPLASPGNLEIIDAAKLVFDDGMDNFTPLADSQDYAGLSVVAPEVIIHGASTRIYTAFDYDAACPVDGIEVLSYAERTTTTSRSFHFILLQWLNGDCGKYFITPEDGQVQERNDPFGQKRNRMVDVQREDAIRQRILRGLGALADSRFDT